MAFQFNVNLTPSTGVEAIWDFLQLLITAGWTVPSSGDGLALFSSSSNILTGFGTGAGGLGNPNAWFRVQSPTYAGNHREFIFQIGSSSIQWRVKYSPAAQFTSSPSGGGSASSTVTPSAPDEQYVWTNTGSFGTDAAPQFAQFLDTDGSYKWHCVAGQSTEGYSFYTMGFPSASKTISRGFAMIGLDTTTTLATDPDPTLLYFPPTGSTIYGNTDFRGTVNVRGFFGSITGCTPGVTRYGSTFNAVTNATPLSGIASANNISGKDDLQKLSWARVAAPGGYKGVGLLAYGAGVTRTNLDTLNTVGTKDRIYVNATVLPWAGVDPTGVTVSNFSATAWSMPFGFKPQSVVIPTVNPRTYSESAKRYALRAFAPALGNYVYWVDSDVSTKNAPSDGGGGYQNLQVLGTF